MTEIIMMNAETSPAGMNGLFKAKNSASIKRKAGAIFSKTVRKYDLVMQVKTPDKLIGEITKLKSAAAAEAMIIIDKDHGSMRENLFLNNRINCLNRANCLLCANFDWFFNTPSLPPVPTP